MGSDRFRRLEELFHAIVDLPPGLRREAIERECGDASDLRRELEALLLADGALEEPSTGPGGLGPCEPPGKMIGPYRIVRRVAEGGMGVVYEARQDEPIRRTVALKLIRAGFDSAKVVARFDVERQALALMEHPDIARVFDAGVSDEGSPYFVMEMVEGEPIHEFCERRRLGLTARLELFVRVCDAVQHAHQKGVIHRDLKPSNILVTDSDGQPAPRIIDFGVAKAVDARYAMDAAETGAGELVGTPEYMSPEQAEPFNRDIDTRSDVYALGVVLYEILTGSHPFRRAGAESQSVEETLRKVRSLTPPRPSVRLATGARGGDTAAGMRLERASAARRLRGDLDWIVVRAMEKDRERRYPSAADLGADIRRHLNDEPVSAGPPSRAYRARKFVARHRFGVSASGALLIVLIGGITATSIALFYKDRAEEQARRDVEIARATTAFLMDVFEGANLWSVGSEPPTVLDVARRAAGELESDRRKLDPAARGTMMRSLGQVLMAQSQLDDARPLLKQAVELHRGSDGERSESYGLSLMRLAQLESFQGNHDESVKLARLGEQTVAVAAGERSAERGVAAGIAGAMQLNAGDRDGAAESLARAIDVLRPHADEYGPELGAALVNLARVTPDEAVARRLTLESTSLLEKTLPGDHPNLAQGYLTLSDIEYRRGDFTEAVGYQARAVEVMGRALPPHHWQLVYPRRVLAAYQLSMGQGGEARRTLEESLDAVTLERGEDSADAGSLLNDLALLYLLDGDFEVAAERADRAVRILEGRYGRESSDVAVALHTEGDIVADAGDPASALTLYEETKRIREALGEFADDPYAPVLLESMSRARRRAGDLAGAHDDMVEAVRLYESSPFWDARTLPRARISLAAIRAARGEAERAAEEYGRADAALRALPGRPSIYDSRDRTVYLAASGDPAATLAAAREAVDFGLHAAVLAVEPEVRALFDDEPELAALLGDD